MNGEFPQFINREYIVIRSRISERINNEILFNKILYVYAPIGWGKTIAVAGYVNEYLEKKTWYEINEEDNDPRNFLISLIKVIGNIEKDSNVKKYCNIIDNINFDNDLKTIVNMLNSCLKNDRHKKVIIFDNLQIINNELVLNILADFISISPKNYKFIFLSRKKVPAQFSNFVVNREIQVMNSSDLIFNEEDIKEFYLKENINFNDSNIKEILRNTGGWPAGMSAVLMYLKLNNLDLNSNESFNNNLYLNSNENLNDNLNLNNNLDLNGNFDLSGNFNLNNDLDLDSIFKNNEYVNNFLTKNLWDNWNYSIKNFFMKVSLFNELELDECMEITGIKESKEILEDFVEIRTGEAFKFNPMFLSFLREKSKELEPEEKAKVYKKAGQCFERKNLNLKAVECYHSAGDIQGEIRNLEKLCTSHMGVALTQLSTVKRYINNIPKEITFKNPILCSFMAIIEYTSYSQEDGEKWYGRLLNIKESIIREKDFERDNIYERYLIYKEDFYTVTNTEQDENKEYVNKEFIKKEYNNGQDYKDIILDNHNKALKYKDILSYIDGKILYTKLILTGFLGEEIIDQFGKLYEKRKENHISIENISLTLNCPSILRGIRDTHILWERFIDSNNDVDRIFQEIHGSRGLGIPQIAFAEINYEKNELNLALLKLTSVITKCIKNGHVDTLFTAYIIFEKVMCANGYSKEAKTVLGKIKDIIEEKKAGYLLKNFNAVYARFNLLNGDNHKAKDWFYEYGKKNENKFNILNTYEYMTKARVYIAYGEYKMATSFLEIIYSLNYDYKYTTNLIECCILQSIALYRDGDENLALKKIEEALEMAEPLGYIRIFADEGGALHEVLSKYLKHTKLDKDINMLYIKKIMGEARKFAELYPKYLKREDVVHNVQLTKSEVQILRLIYKGMSNVEISEYLGIKKDTVKFHVRNIYSKLNVKNRMQAVKMADKIGIMNEKKLM